MIKIDNKLLEITWNCDTTIFCLLELLGCGKINAFKITKIMDIFFSNLIYLKSTYNLHIIKDYKRPNATKCAKNKIPPTTDSMFALIYK